MQKKLIALAIAAAFSAPAMADVTMYGIIDAAVARVSQTAKKTDTLAVSGGLSGSRLGVKGAEDLDNGMKAVVVLEYSLDTQQADALVAARQEMLAVAGGFGTVATGYLQTTGYDFAVKFDPTAGSSVSPLQNMTKGNASYLIGTVATAARAPRALAYISPDLGGVTVAVNYATTINPATGNLTVAETGANSKTSATLLSATYTGVANLVVGVVHASTSGTSSASAVTAYNNTDIALGASYDLGVAKLMGTYQTAKNSAVGTAGNSNKLMSFSAVAPVGPGAVVVTYAKATIGATTVAGANENGSGYTLAYLQGMSKTVTAYGALSKVTNGSGTNKFSVGNNLVPGGANGSSSTMIAVGLKKVF